MAKLKERTVYWSANIGGWTAYILLSGIIMGGEQRLTEERLYALLTALPIGILLSHGMRGLFIRLGWLDRSILSLIPRVLLNALFFGLLFSFVHAAVIGLVRLDPGYLFGLTLFDLFQSVLNWSLLLLFWSVIYFAYHFFELRRQKEIEALQWQASRSELELEQLKDQLDPHFIFNCLNSIRALVQEDPDKAKKALTKLSSTLRNSLTLSRKRTISLREELAVVEDYLALERIRLEERLSTEFELPDEALDQRVPPLLIQSLVENGIKHGISRIPEGGLLRLHLKEENGSCSIVVENPVPSKDNGIAKGEGSGTGRANARRRLRLLFGDRASMRSEEGEGSLRTIIRLPLDHAFTDDHHR